MKKFLGFIKTIICRIKHFFVYKFYKGKSLYKAISFECYEKEKLKKKYFKKVLKLDNLDDVISSIGKAGFMKDVANVTDDIDAEKLMENSVYFYLENKPNSKRLPISIELYSHIEGFEELEICILSRMKKVRAKNKWGIYCNIWIAVSSEWFINYNKETKKVANKQKVYASPPKLAFNN